MKKLFAVVLTLVMVASLSVPVLAYSVPSNSAGSALTSSGYYSGDTYLPTLTITVKYFGTSTAGSAINKLILNPYGATVKSSTVTDSGSWIDTDGTTSQVIGSPISIKSATESAVDVVLDTGAVASAGGNLEFVTKDITKATEKPSAYIYMCATDGSDDSTKPTDWPAYDKNSCWLFSTTATTKDITLYTLGAAATASDATYCWVGVTGSLNSEFTATSNYSWTTNDKAGSDAKLKFNFAMESGT